MKDRNISVAFCVVNYKTPQLTIDTINNILGLNGLNTVQNKIFLLENGSRDGSEKRLKLKFKNNDDVQIITSNKNLGFAGGQDLLKQYIKDFDYVALINSDCLLKHDWLKQALDTFKRDSSIAAAGGRAYLWDDHNKLLDNKNDFYSFQFIDPWRGLAYTANYGDYSLSVDSISGAALMLDVKKALQVGYFNRDYFLYYEETDLQAKLKRAGYQVMYNPKMEAWHQIGASSSSDGSFNKVVHYYMNRNRFLFGYTNFDQPYKKQFVKNYYKDILRSFIIEKTSSAKINYLKCLIWPVFHYFKLSRISLSNHRAGDNYSIKLKGLDKDRSLTVVITAYNYGKFLSDAISSVLSQTEMPSKIIIINDGSTDNTKDVLANYKSNNLITIINQKNIGIAATRNRAIKMLSTKWVIFLDADDKLDKNYIKKVLNKSINDELDLVYTDAKMFGAIEKVHYFGDFTNSYDSLYPDNCIHNSALMRSDIVNTIGGYNTNLPMYEDWEMFIRYSKLTERIGKIKEPLLFYRIHDQVKSRNSADGQDNIKTVEEIHRMHPRSSFPAAQGHKLKTIRELLHLIKLLIKNPFRALKLLLIPVLVVRDIVAYLYRLIKETYSL